MKITPILSRFQKIRNWTNQQSKSYGIGQKINSAPLTGNMNILIKMTQIQQPAYCSEFLDNLTNDIAFET